MMAFGLPDLNAVAANAIAKSQAAGLVLEDHETVALQGAIHAALVEATADMSPILDALNKTNETIEGILEFLKRLDGASVKLELPPAPATVSK
jgi:hypothetical protein